jgi:hypothetical protein
LVFFVGIEHSSQAFSQGVCKGREHGIKLRKKTYEWPFPALLVAAPQPMNNIFSGPVS